MSDARGGLLSGELLRGFPRRVTDELIDNILIDFFINGTILRKTDPNYIGAKPNYPAKAATYERFKETFGIEGTLTAMQNAAAAALASGTTAKLATAADAGAKIARCEGSWSDFLDAITPPAGDPARADWQNMKDIAKAVADEHREKNK